MKSSRLFALAVVCACAQFAIGELFDYSFDDFPKLLLLGVNLWLFLTGCLVMSTPNGFYSPINIISIASIYVFYVKPMYILSQHTDTYPLVTYGALIFLTCFNAIFYAGYGWQNRRLARRPTTTAPLDDRGRRVLISVLWIGWVLGAAALVYSIGKQGGLAYVILRSDYYERTRLNTEASFGEQLNGALQAAAFLAPAMLLYLYQGVPSKKWIARLLLFAVIAAIPAILLLGFGRRLSVALVFALAVILFRNPPRWARLSALTLALLAPFLFAYLAALRGLPIGEIDRQELVERRDQIFLMMFDTPELSMFDEYCKVYNDFGESLPLRYGADYYKVFLIPVPRSVMPDKPFASGTKFLDYYYPDWYDSIGGAVTISTPGELLWNLSYFGIIGAFLYALFFAYIDHAWLHSNNDLRRGLYVLGGFSLAFGFVRGCHHLVLLEFLTFAWPPLVTAAILNLRRTPNTERFTLASPHDSGLQRVEW